MTLGPKTRMCCRAVFASAALCASGGVGPAVAQALPPSGFLLTDASGDAFLHRVDAGADGPVLPPVIDGRPGNFPDIVSLRWGGWTPAPVSTPTPKKNFSGVFNTQSRPSIVRIDMTFRGLINPPGPLGVGGVYNPYKFGNSPLFGFIEIDLDGNINTGGELGDAAQSRYLAVAGRFGQLPQQPLLGRVALTGAQLDGSFNTAPFFERSGADFTIAFCGCFEPEIVETDNGDCDQTFEPGEAWIVRGRFFQRAGGFTFASAAYNGSQPGAYDPLVHVRFSHCAFEDTTTVSLVYGVTQEGAARLRCGGCAAEPINLDVSDDTSIHEAMADICEGAMDPFLPIDFPETWVLAMGWATEEDGEQALSPDKWVFRAALATAHSIAQKDAFLVWTDLGFDEVIGDYNGDGVAGIRDRAALVAHVWATDESGFDCDPSTMGRIGVCAFGHNFSAFDLNYDGFVDALDAAFIPDVLLGDFNGDCAVTTIDLIYFLGRFANPTGANILTGDLTNDGAVNTLDLTRFLPRFGSVCP